MSKNELFVATFVNEIGTPRLVFAMKNKNDTLEDFLNIRAPKAIYKKPLNKFDAISNYSVLVHAVIKIDRSYETKDDNFIREIITDKKHFKITEENMVDMLKGMGYVIYKKKK